MTTDHETDVQSARDIIRSFLSLPVGALPWAQWDDDEECQPCREALREYMIDSDSGMGRDVILGADRPEWNCIRVTLV